jgi:hypothetical protein
VNNQIKKPPPRMNQSVSDSPQSPGAPAFGTTQPQVLERSTPKTASESPEADNNTPTMSSFGRSPGGSSAIRRLRSKIATTISTSPANTNRHDQ